MLRAWPIIWTRTRTDAETLFHDKIRLQHQLDEATEKVNMLLVKTDGGCQKLVI